MLAYPNYDKSVLSVISSIKNYYRTSYAYPTSEILDKELSKRYKNIVLINLDGLGTNLLEDSVPKSDFLRKNFKLSVSSVYPSSPTASLVSLVSGLSPNEHGWLGSSLYLKEYSRMIDIVLNSDAYTRQSVSNIRVGDYVMPYESVFEDLTHFAAGNVQPFAVSVDGAGIPEKDCLQKYAEDFDRVCEIIAMISRTDQNTFTFVQWNKIMETAQKLGCDSVQVKENISSISRQIHNLCGEIEDTLIIVSSGHGMTDISEEILINNMHDIMECLIIPPFVEDRAISFFVKSDRRTDFERLFNSEFSGEFLLISRNDFLSKGILGAGNTHVKTSDFIGDYFACAISDVSIKYRSPIEKPKAAFKAGFGGLTENEMFVPVIFASTAKKKKPVLKISELFSSGNLEALIK